MQKYYHRGAFYLDQARLQLRARHVTASQDETVLKRSVDEPTLEDKFNKAVLPKVMQVKDFGFAGRTKYTHLKDQDTTQAWSHARSRISVLADGGDDGR